VKLPYLPETLQVSYVDDPFHTGVITGTIRGSYAAYTPWCTARIGRILWLLKQICDDDY